MQNASSPLKRVCAVNDISCFGKCSLTVSLPLMSRFGVEVVPLPTVMLSTHTGDFSKPTRLDLTDEMQKIIAHWESFQLKFDCVYTGYMLDKQLPVAAGFVNTHKKRGALIVVDPVMGDNGRLYSGFEDAFPMQMKALCAGADVITPNFTEAMLLTGLPYKPVCGAAEKAQLYRRLAGIGAKNSVITGVRANEDEIGDVVVDENGQVLYEKYLPATDRRLHGCGDVFASVLTARLMQGETLTGAVEYAQDFTCRCIDVTNRDAENHWYGLKFESLMDEISL